MPAIKLKKATADYLAEKERARERERAEEENRPDPLSPDMEESVAPKKVPKEPYKSFLDGDILTEKRKRCVPVADQKLDDWLTQHLESKEEVRLNLQRLFDYYKDACELTGTPVIHFQGFCQVVRKRFGKTFALKDSSPLKSLMKQLKVKPKSAQSPSQKLKMKDIINEALSAVGNQKNGASFQKIKQFVAAKYPVLHSKNKTLKAALERGVYYGKVDLVRGVGCCGYYRLPGVYADSEEEKTEETENQEEDSTEGEVTKNGETEDGDKDAEKGGEKKKKKRKRTTSKPMSVSRSRHANPFRVEDTFPLALTFMSEPKEASVNKIKRYIMENYPDCNIDARLKKALERGEEHGIWQQVSGTGAGTGSYRLLIQEFNPSLHDSIDDMICSALIACSEPKQASASSVKNYIQEYHSNFNILTKPHLFRLALERAIAGQMVVRVSGIGLTGSFQLVKPFTPTPSMLAGNEEDSEEEDDEEYVPRSTKSRRGSGSAKETSQRRAGPSKSRARKPAASRAYVSDSEEEEEVEREAGDKYVPRKSKSRGGSAVAKPAPKRKAPSKPAPSPAKKSKGSEQAAGKKKSKKKGSKQPSRTPPPKVAPRAATSSEEEEEEEEEVVKVEYTPRKSKSRGGSTDVRPPAASRKKSQSGREATPRKHVPMDDEDSGEEDDALEYTPQKSRSRGGSTSKRPSSHLDSGDDMGSAPPKTKKQKAAASHKAERSGRKR